MFDREGLDEPQSEPIGMFYENGIKTFLWRGKFWIGIEYDYFNITKKMNELIQQNKFTDDQTQTINDFFDIFEKIKFIYDSRRGTAILKLR